MHQSPFKYYDLDGRTFCVGYVTYCMFQFLQVVDSDPCGSATEEKCFVLHYIYEKGENLKRELMYSHQANK